MPKSLKDVLEGTEEEFNKNAIKGDAEDLKEKELNNKKKLLELELSLL